MSVPEKGLRTLAAVWSDAMLSTQPVALVDDASQPCSIVLPEDILAPNSSLSPAGVRGARMVKFRPGPGVLTVQCFGFGRAAKLPGSDGWTFTVHVAVQTM